MYQTLKAGGEKKSRFFFSSVLLEDNIWSVIAQNITKTSVGKLGKALREIK